MNRHSLSLWHLLLVQAGLATLLGLGLASSPRMVLGLFPSSLKMDPMTLLQAAGLLLFGMSLSLWVLVDVRRTDYRSRVAELVGIGLVLTWPFGMMAVSAGETWPGDVVSLVVGQCMTLICVGILGILWTRSGDGCEGLDAAGESAAQQERSRLARDLHDSIKQQLFSIKLSSTAAEERWESDPGGARAALADVRRSAQAAMVEMQAMLNQLRPEPLANAGLVEALREQCEALGYRSGIPVRFEIGDLPPDDRLPDSTRENLFRIAQEALSNAAHHARARSVEVWLGQVGQSLLLQIRDDGQGFDPAVQSAGMGLRNMRERLAAVHGTLELRSAPGEGTEVKACAPLILPRAPGDPVRKLAADAQMVVFLLFLVRPSLVLLALAATHGAVSWRTRKSSKQRPEPDIRWNLFRHQHHFLLLALAFWVSCAIVPTLEVPNTAFRWLAVPLYWLDQAGRLASPVILLLALREAWRFFRVRRSLDVPAPEAGLPVWVFAGMLLILLASVPLLFLISNPWNVARMGLLSCAILYLGWRLRTVS